MKRELLEDLGAVYVILNARARLRPYIPQILVPGTRLVCASCESCNGGMESDVMHVLGGYGARLPTW